MRVLLALRERDASIVELASRLDRTTSTIRRAGRRMSARGLVRWRHVGESKTTTLGISPGGLATTRALITAIGDARP
jgi:DNA-binding MarR family transcriptional regulator